MDQWGLYVVSNLPDGRKNDVVSVLVCLEILCCWHRIQLLAQERIFLSMSGQKYLTFINLVVGVGPGWEMSWNMSKILLGNDSGMYGQGVVVDRLHQMEDPCMSYGFSRLLYMVIPSSFLWFTNRWQITAVYGYQVHGSRQQLYFRLLLCTVRLWHTLSESTLLTSL